METRNQTKDNLRLGICFDAKEWESAQNFRQTYFFDKAGVQDPYIWTFDHPKHTHFVLYSDKDIVGYAHIQHWPQSQCIMRIIVIDERDQGKGSGKQFLCLLEDWLRTHGIKKIHVDSRPDTVGFYLKQDYHVEAFEDPDGDERHPQDTPLVKILDV